MTNEKIKERKDVETIVKELSKMPDLINANPLLGYSTLALYADLLGQMGIDNKALYGTVGLGYKQIAYMSKVEGSTENTYGRTLDSLADMYLSRAGYTERKSSEKYASKEPDFDIRPKRRK